MKGVGHYILNHRSLFLQVADQLRALIFEHQIDSPLPSENDLAARFGISRPVVRRAMSILADEGILDISNGRRARVNHRKSLAARDPKHILLLTALSNKSALVQDDILLLNIRHYLQGKGHIVQECFDHRLKTTRSWRFLDQIVQESSPDRIMLFGSTPALQRWAEQQSLPAFVVGTTDADINLPSLDTDYHALGRHAAAQLAKAGRKRICILLPVNALAGDHATIAGMKTLLTSQPELQLKILRIDSDPHIFCQKIDSLLSQALRPDAFFSFYPQMTVTLQTHLLRRGVRIPKDLSIISRESSSFIASMVPTPTRYQRNEASLLRHIQKLVDQSSSGFHKRPIIRLSSTFIEGETLSN